MNDFALLERTALAVAIGLLIGIERGWQEREAHDGARVAGIRTFALIGALGAVCGLLAAAAAPSVFGFCFLAFSLPFGFFEWRRAQTAQSYSATDMIAGLLTFAIGAYAVRGSIAVAGAAGVVATVILAERRLMHGFLKKLKWTELRAALLLLVMTAVLLPALPDRTIDPWGALNPYQIWLMTVLAAAVSFAGYIAVRLAGDRKGLLYAGVMGGLVTSTTVTWTFAGFIKRAPALLPKVMTAILAAWIVSLLRMTILAVALAPVLMATLALPIAAATGLLLTAAVIIFLVSGKGDADALTLQNPFELPLILRLTALLVFVMLVSKLLSAYSGPSGLFALGGVSGLLDVDPITLSMAGFTHAGLAPATAATTILIAAAANGLAKSVLAWSFGGTRLGLYLSGLALAALGAGALVYFA